MERDTITTIGTLGVSLIVIVAYCGATLLLFFYPLPDASKETVTMMFGGLNIAFGGVVGYWIGSSNNSQKKDATIATLATTSKKEDTHA